MNASFAGLAGAFAAAIVLGGCSPIENREDFAAQLKNKTEPEVLKFAGKPAKSIAAILSTSPGSTSRGPLTWQTAAPIQRLT